MNFSVIHKRIKDKFNKEEHIHCHVYNRGVLIAIPRNEKGFQL